MLKLLANINIITDTNFSVSTFYQLLKFAVTNISISYAVCGFIIVMCMFATTLRNLIYKVLNLAVMSVFVVALWAYMTDVTFIYIVYILAFVSAVVMLFLSVVLMLPSSAIAVSKRNLAPAVLLALISTPDTDTTSIITVDIIAKLCAFLAAVYFVLSVIKAWKYLDSTAQCTQSASGAVAKPNYYVSLIVYHLRWTLANFISCLSSYYRCGRWQSNYSSEDSHEFDAQWKYDNASLKFNKTDFSKLALKLVPASAVSNVSKIANKLTIHTAAFFKHVVCLFDKIVVVTLNDLMHTFKLHPRLLTALAGSEITQLSRRFVFAAFYNALFEKTLGKGKFLFIKNFLIFNGSILLFSVWNVITCCVVFLTAPTNIELIAQVVATLSIFFIAVPVGLAGSWSSFTYSAYLVDAGVSKFGENLAAIQQGLYVDQPLLLLVSITGLLVALIGAPFFVSRNK